jgi:hypothetical protein
MTLTLTKTELEAKQSATLELLRSQEARLAFALANVDPARYWRAIPIRHMLSRVRDHIRVPNFGSGAYGVNGWGPLVDVTCGESLINDAMVSA